MITKNQEVGSCTGEFAQWIITPETLHKELSVSTTAQQASLTPTSGKKIRVHSISYYITVLTTMAISTRGSISFGTGGVTNSSKVLVSGIEKDVRTGAVGFLSNLNVVGATNETVTLTNITFSSGTVEMGAVIYYTEE